MPLEIHNSSLIRPWFSCPSLLVLTVHLSPHFSLFVSVEHGQTEREIQFYPPGSCSLLEMLVSQPYWITAGGLKLCTSLPLSPSAQVNAWMLVVRLCVYRVTPRERVYSTGL